MTTLVTTFLTILAQTKPAAGPAPAGGISDMLRGPFPLIIGLMLVWMFFMSNSKRKQEKQKQELLNSMKRGDRIQTIGGILGTVVEVRDNEVVVKVDEGNNTKIKFTRASVSRVVREEDKADSAK